MTYPGYPLPIFNKFRLRYHVECSRGLIISGRAGSYAAIQTPFQAESNLAIVIWSVGYFRAPRNDSRQ